MVTGAHKVCLQVNTAANLQICSSGHESCPLAARTQSLPASVPGPSSWASKSDVWAGACAVNIVVAGFFSQVSQF